MKKWFGYIVLLLSVALLSACGGGSQSSPTSRSLKSVIKTTALTATLNIGGVQMAITLPAGVAPELKPDGSVNNAAAIEFISSAPSTYTLQNVTYNSAASELNFSVIDLAGFTTEDQIVLHLKVLEGTPKESDFSIKSYNFFDKVTGASISGLNPTLTTTIL